MIKRFFININISPVKYKRNLFKLYRKALQILKDFISRISDDIIFYLISNINSILDIFESSYTFTI